MQKERQEKEEEEKKEKQRQEAEEQVRRMHEDTDSLEDRLAAVTEQQKDVKTPAMADESAALVVAQQVPDVISETVEVDADTSSSATATNTDKATKTSASTSSSEDVDEEVLEGEEGVTKIGKDGKS